MYAWLWELHVLDKSTDKIVVISEESGFRDRWDMLESFFGIMQRDFAFLLLDYFYDEHAEIDATRILLDDYMEVFDLPDYSPKSVSPEFSGKDTFYNLSTNPDLVAIQRFILQHVKGTKEHVYTERFFPLDVFFNLHMLQDDSVLTYIPPDYGE